MKITKGKRISITISNFTNNSFFQNNPLSHPLTIHFAEVLIIISQIKLSVQLLSYEREIEKRKRYIHKKNTSKKTKIIPKYEIYIFIN